MRATFGQSLADLLLLVLAGLSYHHDQSSISSAGGLLGRSE